LKKEIATQRAELLRDLNKPMEDALAVARVRLNKTQRDLGPLPEPSAVSGHVGRVKALKPRGLPNVGVCLVLGLLTRTSCVAGAAFLLLFYLAMPSLPWLPANPRAEGHYLFINKNIIEMIALLTLATTQSGKWVGVDGLVQFLNPFRRREPAPAKARPQPVA